MRLIPVLFHVGGDLAVSKDLHLLLFPISFVDLCRGLSVALLQSSTLSLSPRRGFST